MNKNVSLIVFICAVLVILWAISGNKAPKIPGNERHAAIADAAACPGCHANGKASPLKPAHPPKEQCLLCHKR